MEGGKEKVEEDVLDCRINTQKAFDETSGQVSSPGSSTVFTTESVDSEQLHGVFSLVKSSSGR